ncbi:4-hydroxyphenylacetate 3-hydroxylase C-terminal domain-containing protein [Candidatus Amarobacter glycogenicus]|uniref:4-hydroxyphenylacetate 3-hydroxylase C-terminal domain-containing protein n=1 Tax=Candidatus Amarobacter glycogenicus TaxID=3140699 RepID=UPI002A158CF5|nr:hypothetical protein [Dehalococcoidia bacterium]
MKIVASPYGGSPKSEFDAPERRPEDDGDDHHLDDVFVPGIACSWPASTISRLRSLAFVEYHRFTAVSYKLPLVDALIGSALLMADMNGIAKAAHVRDKMIWLISYAETLRALTEMAAIRGTRRCGRHFSRQTH